jgi:hypothetical protein
LCPIAPRPKILAVVFNRKPPTSELPSLLSPVLWLLLRVQLFFCRLRPKHPDAPCTEAQALAWLQHMLQAIDAFALSAKNGTLPPITPPADIPTPNAPCAAPPPRPQTLPAEAPITLAPPSSGRTTPETKSAPTAESPRSASPMARHGPQLPPHRARPITHRKPRRSAPSHRIFLKKNALFGNTPNHAHFVTIS